MTISEATYYDVIHIHTTKAKWYSHNPQIPCAYPSDYYYAKNVGLIRSEENSSSNPDPVIKNLVSHQIGPH